MKFELTEEQVNKANAWFKSIMERDQRHPFDYGATGGGLSYCFTPTGLGVIVTVQEALSKETLNLTDFSDW